MKRNLEETGENFFTIIPSARKVFVDSDASKGSQDEETNVRCTSEPIRNPQRVNASTQLATGLPERRSEDSCMAESNGDE